MNRPSAVLPPFDPMQGTVVLSPEKGEPGYWSGCAGVLRHDGRFWLTYRQRRPRGAEAERGWRCAVAAIVDRVTFNAHILETGTQSYRLRTSKTTSRGRKPR